jgi:type IV secretory pathway VirB2 component (pilin)
VVVVIKCLWIAGALLQVGDALSTWYTIRKHGSVEANPIGRFLMNVFGMFWGVIIGKVVVLVLITPLGLGLLLIKTNNSVLIFLTLIVLIVFDALYILAVFNNMFHFLECMFRWIRR